MKTINVLKKFILTLDNGVKREFEQGVQEVEAAIASHWYVVAHSAPVEDAAAAEQTLEAKIEKAEETLEAVKTAIKKK